MRQTKRIFIIPLILTLTLSLYAQHSAFKKVYIISDTVLYSSKTHSVKSESMLKTYFYYSKPQQVVEFRLFPATPDINFELVPSRDYVVVDSMINLGDYSRIKVQFSNLNTSDLLRLTLKINKEIGDVYEEIHLQPLYKTTASIKPADNELFIGEEKTYEVFSNNPDNIQVSNEWISAGSMDYRFSKEGGKLFLSIIPQELGRKLLTADLSSNNPFLENLKLVYSIPSIEYEFNVKASRLKFLGLDKNEITLEELTRTEGIEIQIQDSPSLSIKKTYRIENQEVKGGALIAEIFTKQRLSNNRVLCVLRPYNYHKSSDGYLYIKDGDIARFITNVSITHKTQIDNIYILREGQGWNKSTTIYPGESFDIKLEGKGLHKAKFHFEDLLDVSRDTLIKSEKEQYFKLQVPVDITKRQITIYNHNLPSGHNLQVSEFQSPRDFDFVYMSYGDMARRITGVREPILYSDVVKDMTFSFNTNKIDDDILHGKQYLKMQINITGKNNELIELRTIENIVVCPSEKSPRSAYYQQGTDCINGDVSLNKYLHSPTYNLEGWSRIRVKVEHDKSKHGGKGYEKELDVILKRAYRFDLDVSFPAGLLTISPSDTSNSIGSLSGISMALIGQFSFYHPDKINKLRPYKIGAGFLALNAFNFSDDASTDRDVGLVVLASVYPTTRDTKLSFPLYVGGGYYIKAKEFVFLVGPGIRVSF